ncbi:hypothetical protein GCM10010495_70640 [Kitasatospora herbaricolor]|nr:hypothetical protein [Kitasatospora herbaricolor]GGV42926.1 hypothetical protein GCM10010495_70640 [Kitasatospora herbaricolor]
MEPGGERGHAELAGSSESMDSRGVNSEFSIQCLNAVAGRDAGPEIGNPPTPCTG